MRRNNVKVQTESILSPLSRGEISSCLSIIPLFFYEFDFFYIHTFLNVERDFARDAKRDGEIIFVSIFTMRSSHKLARQDIHITDFSDVEIALYDISRTTFQCRPCFPNYSSWQNLNEEGIISTRSSLNLLEVESVRKFLSRNTEG